jgi:hypothetical protein
MYRASAKKRLRCVRLKLPQKAFTYLGHPSRWKVVIKISQKKKKKKEKKTNSDPHPNYTKASTLGHCWLLQALDTWVCILSCPVVPLNQERGGVCVDPESLLKK